MISILLFEAAIIFFASQSAIFPSNRHHFFNRSTDFLLRKYHIEQALEEIDILTDTTKDKTIGHLGD